MTNLLTRVPKRSRPSVATMVRTIYKQLSPEEVHAQAQRVIAQLQEHFPQADWQTLSRTSWPSPPSRYLIGRSSGPTARWNGSTRRSVVAMTWWASSPTGRRLGVWWARCWPSSMTNGSKAAATSPSPTISTPRPYRPATYWRQQPEPSQQGWRLFHHLTGRNQWRCRRLRSVT